MYYTSPQLDILYKMADDKTEYDAIKAYAESLGLQITHFCQEPYSVTFTKTAAYEPINVFGENT